LDIPITHFLEYKNVFEEFIAACKENDPDLPIIQNCINVIEKTKEEVYTQKERLEQCQRILKISNLFNPDDLPEPLLMPYRNYVRQAYVDFKVNNDKKKRRCRLFSFYRCIAYWN